VRSDTRLLPSADVFVLCSLTTPFGEKRDVYFKETTFLLFCQTVVNALAAGISEFANNEAKGIFFSR
jgi:hypothetical protein